MSRVEAASIDPAFSTGLGPDAEVQAIVVQGDGKTIIGGYFKTYQGVPRHGIARLNRNGSLDAQFDPGLGADGPVFSVALQTDGKILIGGGFTNVNGSLHSGIARLNDNGSLDTAFTPPVLPFGAVVYTLSPLVDGRIIVGSASFNNQWSNYLFSLRGDGSSDSSFDSGIRANGNVFAAAKQRDGKVVLGGDFTTVGNTPSRRVARLLDDGNVDSGFSFGVGANGNVLSLAVQDDGKILMGGSFTLVNGKSLNHIARLNRDGSVDPNFNPGSGADGPVYAFAVQPDGKVLAGGGFSHFNGFTTIFFARLKTDGGLDPSFKGEQLFNHIVNAISLQPGGVVLVGGAFTRVGDLPYNRVVRLRDEAPPQGTVVAWGAGGEGLSGYPHFGQSTLPNGLTNVIAIAAGDSHSLALRIDGRVVAWGANDAGQTAVPAELNGIVAVAAGHRHNLALKNDGKVVGWGANGTGQTTVPSGLGNVIAIAGGYAHSLALRGDGTVVAWGAGGVGQSGDPHYGQSIVPAGLTNVVAIAAGGAFSLALKGDGTITAWGAGGLGQANYPHFGQSIVPAGSTGFEAIAGGFFHSLGLQREGTVLAWGAGSEGESGGLQFGQSSVPPGLSGVVAIAAGDRHSLGLKFDRTPVAWGGNEVGQTIVPSGLDNVFAIAAGRFHNLALRLVPPAIVTHPEHISLAAGGVASLKVGTVGSPPLSYQWQKDGINIPGATSPDYTITTNAKATHLGNYTVVVANTAGSITSTRAAVTPGASFAYSFTTIAGVIGYGSTDGLGSKARFRNPKGVAVDAAGNVYVADTGNETVRKISPSGLVSTLAGRARIDGNADGTAGAARFFIPMGIAVDGAGAVYVAEIGNHRVRKITPDGLVATWAGSLQPGTNDGFGTAASFNGPQGLAVDSSGTVYVGDRYNNTIRKIDPSGVVSTWAGSAGGSGSANGTGNSARFHYPLGVAVDSAGNVYVADSENHTIRKITPAGVVSTLAGSAGNQGNENGTGTAARFSYPSGVAVDRAGNVYVTHAGNAIRKITPAGVVTTLAGLGGLMVGIGAVDGIGTDARFNYPLGIAVDAESNVYVVDTNNHTVRKINPEGVVTTMAGLASIGGANGIGEEARFHNPLDATLDDAGNIYVADGDNNAIRKITPERHVTTLAGRAGESGSVNGTGGGARFNYPMGIARNRDGIIFVADFFNDTIRKITLEGVVSTYAGLAGQPGRGSADGPASTARFRGPTGVAVDGDGNVYVIDVNHAIRKITPAGFVSTLAGAAGLSGNIDGSGDIARFSGLQGITSDSAGNIFVTDANNYTIRKVTAAGEVSTIAGSAGISGNADGIGTAARFIGLRKIAVDSGGNLFVSEAANRIRKISPGGLVTTIGGGLEEGAQDGVGFAASFADPIGITVDSAGNLYITDSRNNTIRKGTPVAATGPPVILAHPKSQTVDAGAIVILEVIASGAPPLTYQWRRAGVALPIASSATLSLENVTTNQSGSYTVVISNAAGSAESQPATLAVNGPPVITSQPLGRLAQLGANASFSVTASGGSPLSYRWRRDGADLPSATNSVLSLTNVQFAQAGNYSVRVSRGSSAMISAEVPLVVSLSPIGLATQGRGQVTAAPVQSSYTLGQSLVLTATPMNTNWSRFERWSDGDTNNPRIITIGLTNLYTAAFTNFVPLETQVIQRWERVFGGTGPESLRAILNTTDGGYLLGGSSYSGATGNRSQANFGSFADGWVVKIDAEGHKQWDRAFGGAQNEVLRWIEPTLDGGCILAISSESGSGGNRSQASFGNYDYWIVKLDASATVQWDKAFGGSGKDEPSVIRQTPDGGYIVGGSSGSAADGNKTAPNFGNTDTTPDNSDFWVVKLDANGNRLWDIAYGGSIIDTLEAMVPTPDGGYLLGGYSRSGINASKTAANFGFDDYWIVKIDANGTAQWDRTFGGASYDYLRCVEPTADGGYLLGGDSASGISGNKTVTGSNFSDYWVIKLDASGLKQWELALGGSGDEFLYSARQTLDGGFILGGLSTSGAGGQRTVASFGASDFWLVKTDAQGSKQWDRTFGGTNDDGLYSIAQPSAGGYVLGGTSSSGIGGNKSVTNAGAGDFWVVKVETSEVPVGTPQVFVAGQFANGRTNRFNSPAPISLVLTSSWIGPIHYTLDGSMPNYNSTLYNPIAPPQTSPPATIRAIAYRDDLYLLTGLYQDFSEVITTELEFVPSYNLSATTPGGGTVLADPSGGTFPTGTAITLTASSHPGWTFMRWEGDVSSTNPAVAITLNRDISAKAIFGLSLSTTVIGAGSILRLPDLPLYPFGSSVQLTALPAAGRFLASWGGVLTSAISPRELTLTNPGPIVIATFGTLVGANFGLVVQIDGEGTVNYAPATNRFPSNAVVTLTATPKPGHEFAGWSGDSSGTQNPLDLTMNGSKAIKAEFNAGYVFTTLAGSAGNPGHANGAKPESRFHYPAGITVDSAGNVFVAEINNSTIRKITSAGLVTTLAGLEMVVGTNNGLGSAARFFNPAGLVADGNGNLLVADTGNHAIRKVSLSGEVTTLAGLAGSAGSADGLRDAARFNYPIGITVDNFGNIFVADANNHTIRKLTPEGSVTTPFGLAGSSGRVDGIGAAARFASPNGVAADNEGNLYVADTGNHTIRKVAADGFVTTLAGSAISDASIVDGVGNSARFGSPTGIAVDQQGNLFVADDYASTIRKITAARRVTTLAGLAGSVGSTDGPGRVARFLRPFGVAIDSAGNVYVTDKDNHTIRKGAPVSATGAPVIASQRFDRTIAAAGSVSLNVSASGALPMQYQWRLNGIEIKGATNSTLVLTNLQPEMSGEYSVGVSNPSGSASSVIANLDITPPSESNNHFANRTLLTGPTATVAISNLGTSKESGEPNHAGQAGGRSVWWTWTAPAAGRVTIATAGSGFDTLLAVYTGSSVSNLTTISSNDDINDDGTSGVAFDAMAGANYHIGVDGFAGASGNIALSLKLNLPPTVRLASPPDATRFTGPTNITLVAEVADPDGSIARVEFLESTNLLGSLTRGPFSITLSNVAAGTFSFAARATDNDGLRATSPLVAVVMVFPAPLNDLFADRIALTGLMAAANGSNLRAQKEPGEPNHDGKVGGTSVWWTWTAPVSGLATIRTTGSNFDTLLGVYTGSSVSGLTLVASDDDGGGNATSLATFPVVLGTSYHVAVDGFSGGTGGIELGVAVNETPGVSFTAPVPDATFAAPALIPLTVKASDADGSVVRVEFYQDSTLIGAVTKGINNVYSLVWSNVVAGIYAVSARVTDNAGATTVASNLTIRVQGAAVAPRFLAQPQSLTLPAGSTAVFSPSLDGTPPLVYQWRFNGSLIAGATNASLSIADIQQRDDGNYQLSVSNAVSSVVSFPALLSVLTLPSISSQPRTQSAAAGSTVSLSVAANSTSPMNYQWLINGVDIPGATGPDLTLAAVSNSSAGSYSVRVINAAGQITSAEAILTVMSAIPTGQPPMVAREDFWIPDGEVHAMVATNGVLYLGGNFNYVGPNLGSGAAIDRIQGTADRSFPKINGEVRAVLPDEAGGWFVGGIFSSAGELARSNLAHIRADRTVNPHWNPRVNGPVRALGLANGTLYFGGQFTSVNGQSRTNLGAVNAATGEGIGSWWPQADGTVHALVILGTNVIIGGEFSRINESGRKRIAAISQRDGTPTGWKPNANDVVFALAADAATVFAGGQFTSISEQPRSRVAALDAATGDALAAWNPGTDGTVRALAVAGERVLVGGDFQTIDGQFRGYAAALDRTTGMADNWDPQADSKVAALAVMDDTVLIGGAFASIGGQPRHRLAAVEISSGRATSWNPNPNADVYAIAARGDTVYVGGKFISLGGVARRYLAALDLATGVATDWDPAASLRVRALAVAGNRVFVGGEFSSVGGLPRNHLAAVDLAIGAVTAWNPGADDFVRALVVSAGTLFVGGDFTRVGGQARNHLAALEISSGATTDWNPNADNTVLALAVFRETIYAGGAFSTISGVPRRSIAALNLGNGAATLWRPNADGMANALAIDENVVYAGGAFNFIGEQSRPRLAALDRSTGDAATAWNPAVGASSKSVDALVLAGGRLYVGGSFGSLGGQRRNNLAVLNLETGASEEWNPNLNRPVDVLVASGDAIFAGGEFTSVGTQFRPYLAAFAPEGMPVIFSAPRHQLAAEGGNVRFEVAVRGREPLAYQWRFLSSVIPGATNAILEIPRLAASHAGEYTVVISNGVGIIASAPAKLGVLAAPVILLQSADLSVAPGAFVTLTVTATGGAPLLYQWQRNGVNVLNATNAALTLTNAQPASAGSYRVAVANPVGTATSREILLIVSVDSVLPLADAFASRESSSQPNGAAQGTNLGATREAREPLHAGKGGGRSVWIAWRAPANGIATFETLGSTFDTLLAVYLGTSVTNLTTVASDEDSGGFFTSRVVFNAVEGAEYQIAVDGFGGAAGNIVLRWSLEPTPDEVPRIRVPPLSQTWPQGVKISLTISVESTAPVAYQWFLNGEPIPGASAANLAIANLQPSGVGVYVVRVTSGKRVVFSPPAVVEIGPVPDAYSQDKLNDLLPRDIPAAGAQSAQARRRANNFASVSAGIPGTQILDNFGATKEVGEPNHGGVIGGASRWFRLSVASDGVLRVDTQGSDVDTVMAVYTGSSIHELTLQGSDDNGAPDGIRSVVRLPVTRGDYLVAVDGVNGASGNIRLNWLFGQAPNLILQPIEQTAAVGGTASFSVIAAGVPPPTYQWRFNGLPLIGATNEMLTLINAQPDDAGIYTVVASNFAGTRGSHPATLTVTAVLPPLLRDWGVTPEGLFRSRLIHANGPRYIIETTIDLKLWLPISTNLPLNSQLDFMAPDPKLFQYRFYRAVSAP